MEIAEKRNQRACERMNDSKLIPLTQGQFAIVDVENYDWLNQWKWQAQRVRNTEIWYALRDVRINNKRTKQLMHRLLLGLDFRDKRNTDHVNRNGLDNRLCNIRICNNSQNNANAKKHGNRTSSKFKGVCWSKHTLKWQSQIQINSKHLNLGYFDSEIDAAKAYDQSAKKYFGEFARMNTSPDKGQLNPIKIKTT